MLSTRIAVLVVTVSLPLTIAACGDDGSEPTDAGALDAGSPGMDSGPEADAGLEDAGPVSDAADEDSGADDSGVEDAETPDGGTRVTHDCGPEDLLPPGPEEDAAACSPVDPIVDGVEIHSFEIIDPDADALLDAVPEPLVNDGPISFEVELSVPTLAAGESTDVPVAIYLTPTGLTAAEMMDDELRCLIGSSWLTRVTNAPTVHTLEDVVVPDSCFEAGGALVRRLVSYADPRDPFDALYDLSFALQPLPCAASDTAAAPITFMNQRMGVLAEPACMSDHALVGAGCAWEVPISLNHVLDFRVADDTLRTSTCIASADDGASGTPFAQVTLSIFGFGRPWATDRVVGTEPILVDYRLWPSRTDEGDAVALLTSVSEDPSDAVESLDLGGVLVGTIDSRDHTLFLDDETRTRLRTGDWRDDDLFMVEGCMSTPTMPARDVDCALAEVFVDRSDPVGMGPTDEGIPPGAGGASACSGWTLPMRDWDRYLGNRRTVLGHAGAHSFHIVGPDCMATRNNLSADITVLNRYRYVVLGARADGTVRLTHDGPGGLSAALDGQVEFTVLNETRIDADIEEGVEFPALFMVPDGAICAPTFRHTFWGIVRTSLRFCALGEFGWEGSIDYELEDAPFAPPFSAHTDVVALRGSVGPVASLGLSGALSASLLGRTGSLVGQVTLVTARVPVTTTLRTGVTDGDARQAAFDVSADLVVEYGGTGQLIARCSGGWPCPREKVIAEFEHVDEYRRTLLRYPVVGPSPLFPL